MKKVLILMVMAVAFALPSQAQVKFGVQAGLNLTSMSINKSEIESLVKNNAGFFIGPTVKFTVPIVGLSFDAGAFFDQRSAKEKTTDATIKSQTIQIPINVRYGFGLSSIVNIFAFAGPQFGFNVGSKTKEIVHNVSQWTMKGSNLSANVGIGATVLSHLQVKVNYNIALGKTGEIEIWEAAKNTWSPTSNGRANAWQISAAYFF